MLFTFQRRAGYKNLSLLNFFVPWKNPTTQNKAQLSAYYLFTHELKLHVTMEQNREAV